MALDGAQPPSPPPPPFVDDLAFQALLDYLPQKPMEKRNVNNFVKGLEDMSNVNLTAIMFRSITHSLSE
jgi:hypothetical protein